jgi:hypothetical protein
MSNRKHHFVPRFYLQSFRSVPKRINIYNLTQGLEIKDASLRDQCYKHRFYGASDVIEKTLAHIEGLVAPVLQAIQRDLELPPQGSDEHSLIALFAGLQLLRTNVAAERVNENADKLIKAVHQGDSRLQDVDIDAVKFGWENAVLVAMSSLQPMVEALLDLRTHLVCADGTQFFLTSDNPVFKYNKYCEGLKGTGLTGAALRGFHLFIPLSPTVLLMMYDYTVYKVGNKNSRVSRSVLDEDIEALNLIQVISAEQNLYFSDWGNVGQVRKLVQKASRFRGEPRVQVLELVEVGNEDESSLIHSYELTPNLGLELSFLSIRRSARRVPLHERAQGYRKKVALPEYPESPHKDYGPSRRTFRPRAQKPSKRKKG